jgi:hypoxanthine phosphoribosyltransferase
MPEVRESIRESERVLILITPRSASSKWVYIEAGAAWMENRIIVPLIQFVDLSELPEIMRNVQAKRIETEAQKLNLVHEMANIEGKSSSVEISLDFIADQIRLARSKMDRERFQPNLFIGGGRGGAICAAMFASHFNQHALKVVGLEFVGADENRITKIDDSSLKKEHILDKNVLVVEWVRQTGKTFQLIKEKVMSLNPAALRSYALFWTRQSPETPDYYGIISDSVPHNPWSIF